MLHKKSSKIILFLVIPVVIAIISFFYNFAGYLFSAGPLTLGHKEYDNSCFKCHMPLVSVSSSCLSCHKPIAQSLKEKTGLHGHMGEDIVAKCLTCHTDHKGPDYFIITDSRTKAQAEKNLVTIIEGHPQTYRGIDKNVNIELLNFWEKLPSKIEWPDRLKILQEKFDHRFSGYPLTGKHAKIKCEECHKNIKDYKKTEKEGLLPAFSLEKSITKDFCLSCHKKDDDSKKGHKGKYGKDCSSCHILGDAGQGWKVLVSKVRKFHDDPKYELKDSHKKTSCQKCHKTVPFKKKEEEKTCVFCHSKLDKKYHEESLGNKCENCHTPKSFHKSTFDHQKTKFPLKNTHKKIKCQSCHTKWEEGKQKPKIYIKIENPTCFSCHARDDVHRGSFKNDCAVCHRETFWGDTIQR